jgi:hypothetical protein
VVIKCIYLPPTYIHFIQDIEDRCLLLTSSMSFVHLPFQEHRMTEKTSYEPKSMHIFNMSQMRHGHKEYDKRGWCGTKVGPNRAKVGPAGQTSLAGWPGVGAFSNSALPTCQGRSMHGVSNAQSQCGHKTWPPGLTSGPHEPHFWPKHQPNPRINTPILLRAESVKKVTFSFL